jgi:hypothetical protein
MSAHGIGAFKESWENKERLKIKRDMCEDKMRNATRCVAFFCGVLFVWISGDA